MRPDPERDALVKDYLRRRGNAPVPPNLMTEVLELVRRSPRQSMMPRNLGPHRSELDERNS